MEATWWWKPSPKMNTGLDLRDQYSLQGKDNVTEGGSSKHDYLLETFLSGGEIVNLTFVVLSWGFWSGN